MNALSFVLQYLYTDLAAKERAHFTPENETPTITHARKMKMVFSEVSLNYKNSIFHFVTLCFIL